MKKEMRLDIFLKEGNALAGSLEMDWDSANQKQVFVSMIIQSFLIMRERSVIIKKPVRTNPIVFIFILKAKVKMLSCFKIAKVQRFAVMKRVVDHV